MEGAGRLWRRQGHAPSCGRRCLRSYARATKCPVLTWRVLLPAVGAGVVLQLAIEAAQRGRQRGGCGREGEWMSRER
eukprot:1866654-Rhodomonas_salina.2